MSDNNQARKIELLNIFSNLTKIVFFCVGGFVKNISPYPVFRQTGSWKEEIIQN
jgi:hypothetical protein